MHCTYFRLCCNSVTMAEICFEILLQKRIFGQFYVTLIVHCSLPADPLTRAEHGPSDTLIGPLRLSVADSLCLSQTLQALLSLAESAASDSLGLSGMGNQRGHWQSAKSVKRKSLQNHGHRFPSLNISICTPSNVFTNLGLIFGLSAWKIISLLQYLL